MGNCHTCCLKKVTALVRPGASQVVQKFFSLYDTDEREVRPRYHNVAIYLKGDIQSSWLVIVWCSFEARWSNSVH